MVQIRWSYHLGEWQRRVVMLVGSTGLLSACVGLMPPQQVPTDVAPAWQAALPHQGSVTNLSDWWQHQGDPLLAGLIVAAQDLSPSVAQAQSHIARARANQAAARGALLPNLNAQTSASRGVSQPDVPLATTLQGGLQASWELDLVGANRAVSQAAQSQVEGSQAQWYAARVSVAAEVANLYHGLRSCQQLLSLARRDAASHQETARLSAISAQAGLVAPSVAALARASAATASSRVTQQSSACVQGIKGLVALTGVAEPDLIQKMAAAQVEIAREASFSIASVPIQVISQRPDVYAAERDVVLASAQVGSARAQQWGAADTSFRSPMAVAVIGGLMTSTVLSLLVIPAVFTVMDDFGSWVRRLLGRGRVPQK